MCSHKTCVLTEKTSTELSKHDRNWWLNVTKYFPIDVISDGVITVTSVYLLYYSNLVTSFISSLSYFYDNFPLFS